MDKKRILDEINLKILKILQKKARIPNVEVARQVDMAPSAVLERIRKLEKQGYIDGYEVRLNPKRFKRNLVAFITVVTGTDESQKRIGAHLSSIPEVQEVHHIAGEDGFLLKVRVPDTEELGKLLREKILKIDSVRSTRTVIVMSTYKETARIPIDDQEVQYD
jgi:Lrp/AsnC family leucine-responsive transcriptional regulator